METNHIVAASARACLKIAFCKIPSQFASDFMLDLGGVVGYIDEIQHIIRCKVGRKIVGMNFQTRSRIGRRTIHIPMKPHYIKERKKL